MKAIISRYPKVNKEYMYNLIREDIEKNNQVYLVVPEQSTLGSEIEAYGNLGIDSSINFSIKSFRTIVREIIDTLGGRAKRTISENAQIMALKMILNSEREKLKAYQKSIKDNGFTELLLEMIKEIKSNSIDIEDFKKAKKNYEKVLSDKGKKSREDTFFNKLSDFILIFEKYNEKIDKIGLDANDLFSESISKIKNIPQFGRINFYFDRFHDMSQQELDMLKEIDKISPKCVINMVLDERLVDDRNDYTIVKDRDVFETSLKFYNSVKSFTSIISPNKEKYEKTKNSIDNLLEGMFSYEPARNIKEGSKNIKFQKFSNTSEEVENLSISIKKDIVEEGYFYRDIAVIATNRDEYFRLLKRDFDINGIPYFIDDTRNLMDNPMAKYLKSSLALLGSHLKWDKIIQYFKHSFIQVDEQKLLDFQNYVSSRKLRGDMLFDDRYFNLNSDVYLEDRIILENTIEIRDTLKEILSCVEDGYEMLKNSGGDKTLKDYARSLYRFVSNEVTLKNYREYEKFLETENRSDLADENKLVWKNFVEIIDDLVNISGDEKIEFLDFKEMISHSIDRIKIGIIPPGQDQVIIGDITRSRLINVKKMYILGMSNIYYPVSNQRIDLFLEDEKKILNEQNIFLKDTVINRDYNSMLSFYEQLSIPVDSVKFSFSLVNSKNEAMSDSYINEWIKKYIFIYWVKEKLLEADDKYMYYLNQYREYIIDNSSNKSDRVKDRIIQNLDIMSKISFDNDFKRVLNRMFEDIDILMNSVKYRDNIYSKSKLSYYLPDVFNTILEEKYLSSEEKIFYQKVYSEIDASEEYRHINKAIINSENEYLTRNTRDYKLKIKENLAKKIYSNKRISITQLEAYKSCPYRHFIRYGLKPREKYNYDISSMEIGNLAHNITEKLINPNYVFLADEYEKTFDQNYESSIDTRRKDDPRNRFFMKKIKSTIKKGMENLAKQINISRPDEIFLEQKYGFNQLFNPIEIEVDGKLFNIEGKIDRVDKFLIDGEEFYRVIDYKTGNKSFDIAKTFNGIDIQLIIYLYAVVNTSENRHPLGCFYLRLNDNYSIKGEDSLEEQILAHYKLDGIQINDVNIINKIDRSFDDSKKPFSQVINFTSRGNDFSKVNSVIDKMTFENLFKHIIKMVENNIHEILNGEIDIKPYSFSNKKPCDLCEYKAICQEKYSKIDYLDKYNWENIKEILGEKSDGRK